MPDIHRLALFRLSVLGPLVSRGRLERGGLKTIIHELAQRDYDIPGSRRSRIGEKTIEAWYYRWRHQGVEALEIYHRTAHTGLAGRPPWSATSRTCPGSAPWASWHSGSMPCSIGHGDACGVARITGYEVRFHSRQCENT